MSDEVKYPVCSDYIKKLITEYGEEELRKLINGSYESFHRCVKEEEDKGHIE